MAVDEVLQRLEQQYQGMEHFGSRTNTPLEMSLGEVARADLFIGIYAHRYGTVMLNEYSITELEYDYAREMQIPCLAYIIDASHPWLPVHIDQNNREKLENFKSKVSNHLTITRFTTPDDLAKKVAADVSRFILEQGLSVRLNAFRANAGMPGRPRIIGRTAELRKLAETMATERLTILIGPPGSGKTTLALAVAYQELDHGRQQTHGPADVPRDEVMVIWLSTRRQSIVEPSAVLAAIGEATQYPSLSSQDPVSALSDLRHALGTALAYLIIDNLDVEPENAAPLLEWICTLPDQVHTVVTTRYRLSASQGYIIQLSNLDAEDGSEFVRRAVERLALSSLINTGDESLISDILHATEGLPLAIEWTLGQVRRRGVEISEVLEEIQQGTAPVLVTLFGTAWEQLDDDAREILRTLLAFRSGATREALRAVSSMHAGRFEAAIRRLNDLGLVSLEPARPGTAIRVSTHPLMTSFVSGTIQDVTSEIQLRTNKAAEYYIEFSADRRETDVSGNKAREVEVEFDNILYVLSNCFSTGNSELGSRLTYAIEEALLMAGHFGDRVRYCQMSADHAYTADDFKSRAHFLTLVGGTLPIVGDYAAAEPALNEALRCARVAGDAEQQARALRTLALNQFRQGLFNEAGHTLAGVDELARWAGDRHNLIDVRYLEACIRLAVGELRTAAEILEDMLRQCEEIGWERAKSYALKELGEIALADRRFEDAANILNQAAGIAGMYGDSRQLARTWLAVGNLRMYTARKSDGFEWLDRAEDVFRRLAMSNELLELQAMRQFWTKGRVIKAISGRARPRIRYSNSPIGGD